jgi:hypothetical protein
MCKASTVCDLRAPSAGTPGEEIKDLYDAEQQLTKALPKMAKAATNSELRTAVEALQR